MAATVYEGIAAAARPRVHHGRRRRIGTLSPDTGAGAIASGTLARNACYLSATRQCGAHGLRLGLARAGDGSGPSTATVGVIKAGAVHLTVGYDYTLSRRSSVFVYATRLRNDRLAAYDFAINGMAPAAGATLKGYALGLRHNF